MKASLPKKRNDLKFKQKLTEIHKILREIRGKVTQAEKFESKYEVQRLLREIQFLLGKD